MGGKECHSLPAVSIVWNRTVFCFLVDAMTQGQKQMESITRLLKTENVLSLATSGEDGLASVAPLFYVVDEDLSFYWFSSESSTHSRNLKRRPRRSRYSLSEHRAMEGDSRRADQRCSEPGNRSGAPRPASGAILRALQDRAYSSPGRSAQRPVSLPAGFFPLDRQRQGLRP